MTTFILYIKLKRDDNLNIIYIYIYAFTFTFRHLAKRLLSKADLHCIDSVQFLLVSLLKLKGKH